MFRRRQVVAAGLVALGAASSPAWAQAYPSKPIRLVVPFTPGGVADTVARKVGQALAEDLAVPVIVDNRPGAGGTIGADFVAKAAPDGYTLLLGTNGSVSIGPVLYKSTAYDPIRDLAPISSLGVSPIVLEVNPKLPVKTVPELLAHLRANPGKVSVALPGAGTSSHLAAELFEQLTGTSLLHVAYKGSGPALVDLLSGQVDIAFDPLSSSLPFIKLSKLRALAVTSKERSPSLPDTPTLAEAGVKGYDANTYTALFAPSRTPAAIVATLNAAARRALTRPDVIHSLEQYAVVPGASTPDDLAKLVAADLERWSKVVKDGKITVN